MSGGVKASSTMRLLSALVLLTAAGCRDWDGAVDACADAGLCYDPSAPVLVLATDTLPDAYQGAAYTAGLAVSGGRAPYALSVAQGMPTGLSIGAGGFSGTPAVSGNFNLTVRVTDALGEQVEKALALRIVPPPQVGGTVSDGYVSEASAVSLSATGGKPPYTFAQESGTLPPGVELSASTGALLGTFLTAGVYDFAVQVTDANGLKASRPLRMTIYALPSLAAVTPPDGYTDADYALTFTASGGKGQLSFGVPAGAVPTGLTLSPTTGALSGRPAAGGTSLFTVEVTDENGRKASRGGVTIAIYAPPSMTAVTPPDAYTDTQYSLPLPVTGGKATLSYAISAGTPPSGLTLSGGSIVGKPTAAGLSGTFTVEVTDQNGRKASQQLSISTYAPPAIGAVTPADAYTDAAYSLLLPGTGGKGTLGFALVGANTPPAGITLSQAGVLSGTATVADTTSTFTVEATDQNGRKSPAVTLAISTYAPPSFTAPSTPLEPAYQGEAYSEAFTPSGGKGLLVFSKQSGVFPAGLAIDAGGVLSGTVAGVTQDGTASFVLRATDQNGRYAEQALAIKTYLPPVIATTTLPSAIEGITYADAFGGAVLVSGNYGAREYQLSATGLPSGLALGASSGGAAALTGIPAQGTAGAPSVTFSLTDANGRSATPKTLALTVSAAKALTGGGTRGKAPEGSPITQALTVFVRDGRGRALADIGVRLRKNGLEYAPAKEAKTDASGKVFFGGLDLNGTTDTVDITANGAGIANTTLARVNAALVTLVPFTVPMPMPRFGATAFWDGPTRNRLLITQGTDEGERMVDMITHDLIAYLPASNVLQELSPQGMTNLPPPRAFATVGKSGTSADPTYVLFGGHDPSTGLQLRDTWEFAPATNTWTRVDATPAPPERSGAVMLTNLPDVWLFGGENFKTGPLTDVWRYSTVDKTWVSVPAAGGPAMTVGMAAANVAGKFWFCGGSDSFWSSSTTADCWVFDPSTYVWSAGTPLPGPRAFASMAMIGSTAYLFGGRDPSAVPLPELLTLTGSPPAWAPAANASGLSPSARFAANLVESSTVFGLFLFGGTTAMDSTSEPAQPMADLWNYKPDTGWTRLREGPAQGLTLSGTISGAHASSRSMAYVYVSTDSGFSTTVYTDTATGSGTYRVRGLPAGTTLKVHAVNNAPNAGVAGNLYSFVDLGSIGPLTADASADLTFPGPVAVTQTAVTLVPPSTWPAGGGSLVATPVADRTGFSRVTNGNGSRIPNTNTIQLNYYPMAGAHTQTASLYGTSLDPADCMYRYTFVTPVSGTDLGTFTLPDAITGQALGRRDCDPTEEGFQNIGWYRYVSGVTRVAGGDLNNDGKEDLVSLVPAVLKVYVYASTGMNSLRLADVATQPGAEGVAVGDVTGDANLDLVVAHATNGLSVYPGDGTGKFGAAQTLPVTFEHPKHVQVADITGDGKRDVVVVDEGGTGDARLVLFENGGGTLTGRTPLPLGSAGERDLAVGDLMPGGGDEIAVASALNAYVVIANHDLNFPSGLNLTSVTMTSGATGIAIADVVLDSGQDIILASESDPMPLRTVTFSGSFTEGPAIPARCPASHVRAVNLRAGGRAELVTLCADRIATLIEASGLWKTLQELYDPFPDAIVLDFDGNGLPDLVPVSVTQTVFLGGHPVSSGDDTSYSFVAPAGTQTFFSVRFGKGGTPEWQYTGPASPGTVTFQYPLPSTLASSRPWPTGRDVEWDQNVRMFAPGWDYNHWQLTQLQKNYVGTRFFHYRR